MTRAMESVIRWLSVRWICRRLLAVVSLDVNFFNFQSKRSNLVDISGKM
jgi:hypothetical protein